MRQLQFAGIAVSLGIAAYVFWKHKQGRYSRTAFLIGLALAAGLLVLSLFPSAGDLVAGPLAMERWNAVFFVSNLITLGLFFYVLNISNENARTISRLVRALAWSRFREEFEEVEAGEIGVVIPAYNEEENIAAVLGSLLKDGPLRHEAGRKSRAYVEKYHDAHNIARQLVGIYEELIERARARR